MLRYRYDIAQRLAKLPMIARGGRLPLHLIDMLSYDLGLPHDYLLTLLPEFPDYFHICDLGFRFSNGEIIFGLEMKRVQEWVEQQWQNLPYILPYENASHLSPNSVHVERWMVGMIHELLNLLVTKKTEMENMFQFGEIRTQTVVLRVAYRKKLMMEKHPLMVIRNRYISLMELVLRRGRPVRGAAVRRRDRGITCLRVVSNKKDWNRWRRSDGDD
ncbi:protein WHAT'S THIS FACTOR 9, mitochondrial-like [Salvia divinorum]|uniref:Protein WHAT'S THIS FACTOR 9, mitochondrial-like n=1 Tax=Salvia divinorum TaxID=28513 RepID=A0ABD1IEK6_SALDI